MHRATVLCICLAVAGCYIPFVSTIGDRSARLDHPINPNCIFDALSKIPQVTQIKYHKEIGTGLMQIHGVRAGLNGENWQLYSYEYQTKDSTRPKHLSAIIVDNQRTVFAHAAYGEVNDDLSSELPIVFAVEKNVSSVCGLPPAEQLWGTYCPNNSGLSRTYKC